MFSLKITTRCHSVFSLRSPVALSRQLSDVATDRFTTGSPLFSLRISGSLPRLPTKITLLTLPAITASVSYAHKPNRLRSPRTLGTLLDLPNPILPIGHGGTLFLLCSHESSSPARLKRAGRRRESQGRQGP